MVIEVNDFIAKLKAEGLMVGPSVLFERGRKVYEVEQLRKRYLSQKALTFKEIADAEIFGKVSQKAVKEYAKKYAKKLEMYSAENSNKWFVTLSGVLRIAKLKGYQWD